MLPLQSFPKDQMFDSKDKFQPGPAGLPCPFLWCGTGFWFGVLQKKISQENLEAHCSSLAVLIIPQMDQMMCLTSQSDVSGYSFQLCFLVPPPPLFFFL